MNMAEGSTTTTALHTSDLIWRTENNFSYVNRLNTSSFHTEAVFVCATEILK